MKEIHTYESDLAAVFERLQQMGALRDKNGDPQSIETSVLMLNDTLLMLANCALRGDMFNLKALTITAGASLKYIYGQIDESEFPPGLQ